MKVRLLPPPQNRLTMDVNEVNHRKVEVEKQISILLEDFQNETKVRISNVNFTPSYRTDFDIEDSDKPFQTTVRPAKLELVIYL